VKRLRRIAWNGLATVSALLCVATCVLWVRPATPTFGRSFGHNEKTYPTKVLFTQGPYEKRTQFQGFGFQFIYSSFVDDSALDLSFTAPLVLFVVLFAVAPLTLMLRSTLWGRPARIQ
jgi:hypothetical protein